MSRRNVSSCILLLQLDRFLCLQLNRLDVGSLIYETGREKTTYLPCVAFGTNEIHFQTSCITVNCKVFLITSTPRRPNEQCWWWLLDIETSSFLAPTRARFFQSSTYLVRFFRGGGKTNNNKNSRCRRQQATSIFFFLMRHPHFFIRVSRWSSRCLGSRSMKLWLRLVKNLKQH